MEQPQETPETTPETTPPVEPAVDVTALTDDDLSAFLDEATAAVQAAVADEESFDQAAFDAAMERRELAGAEFTARADRRTKFAAAQSAAGALPAARKLPAPTVATMAKPPVGEVAPNASGRLSFSLIAPSDVSASDPSITAGGRYASFSDLGKVLDSRATAMGNTTAGASNSFGLLSIKRHDSEFALTGDVMTDDGIIQQARSQKRLDGGSLMQQWRNSIMKAAGGRVENVSLTAAAGWCAPSETYYDLCEMESMDGILDLPEVTATRGGIRWTQEPTYAQMDAATGFGTLTEAQVIANTAKTCGAVPCPTFTDTRLNVAYTCITGSFLQLRGYPELMARWARGQMVVHAHKLNEAIIAALVAQAGAVTPIAAPAGDPATSAILSAVELAAVDIRYRNRMAFNSVIEVVLPFFALSLIRADYARRNAGDPGLTDAMIMDWFAARSVRPQFVYDWQDGYSGGGATSPGGDATPPYTTTFVPAGGAIQFLAYPAGAVVLARQDVINLRNVYDAASLAQNLYTDTFFEEGWAPIYPCPDLRLYSALACPSGATAVQIDLDCAP